MTKKDLVAHVASEAGLTKKQAGMAVDSVFGGIKKALKKGSKVGLVGFGTFSVKQRKARVGVHPRTQKRMQYPAKKVPYFKPGKALKDGV
ncbi:HU family DNA-binding protein [Candidatus Fermentibacterales bacterium]|nr:HU family DNA-binding protein [Candidatus Fermentibacterales bacterium]